MVPLLPLLLCCDVWARGAAAEDEPDDITWARARIASLEAQLEVQRQRAEEAELQLVKCHARAVEITDDERASRAAALLATSSCKGASYNKIASALPNGSYTKTCNSCVRWEQSVQCHCFSRDAVPPGTRFAPGNLTGVWAVASVPNGPGVQQLRTLPYTVPSGMVVRLDMMNDGSHFTVRCEQTPQHEHDSAGSCAVVGPATSRDQWHTGHGIVYLSNRSATLIFDNGRWLEGAVHNDTIVWKKTAFNSTAQLLWVRQNASAIKTSLSLASCRGARQLTNSNGHLSCDWKLVPPPRVGEIIYGKSKYGQQSVEESCRFVDHVTFVAPQYKRPADPIASIPSINISLLLNQTRDLENISGTWTTFARDGRQVIAQDDQYAVIETIGPPPPPCSHNNSIPCDHRRLPNPTGIRSFDVLCINSGDYGTCSETAEGSSFGHWHFANISLDARTREINISYHHSAAIQTGKIDAHFSTIAWAGVVSTGGAQSSLWSRQSGTDVADCCAHCTATKTCSAWTLDQLNHLCILSSSAATAYPSSSTKGGYALRADPASLCQAKFQNAPASGAWQDNDMPFGVTCAFLSPTGYNKNVSDFPRHW